VVLTSAAGIEHLIAGGLADRASSVESGAAPRRCGCAPPAATGLKHGGLSARVAAHRAHVATIDPKGGGTSGPFIAKLFEASALRAMNQSGFCPNIKMSCGAVESGAATCRADAGERADRRKGVQFAGYLPDELQVVSVYAGAIATQTRDPDLAADFIRFLKSPKSIEAFRNAGWDAG